jgi:hypothetical protein
MADVYDLGGELVNMKKEGLIKLVEENPIIDSGSFPAWVMTGIAGEFAGLYFKYLESPQLFFYLSFLTCLGSFLSDRLTLKLEISPQPRFYTVLIGESADDRKSTAADKTIRFFRETFTEGFNVCYGVGSAEDLQKRLEELEPSRLLLFFDEFKGFVSKCKIDASVLLPCVNTLFESNRYESQTRGSSISLEDSYLSILACTTKQTFEGMWTSTFTDIGFNNRLFLVPGTGQRKYAMPMVVPEDLKNNVKRSLARVVEFVGEYQELDITEEARATFQEWYMRLEQSIHTKRIDTMALRLLPILAVNEGKDVVEIDIVRKAIALANWQLEVRKEIDPIDADNSIAKMEERIRRQLRKKNMTARELKQATHANRDGIWVFDTALKNLQRAEDVSWNKKENNWSLSHV